MSIDLSGYLDVFGDEAREHLQALNEALLAFEKNSADLEHVNVMFRSAHTLKGMSATMGFTAIAELTHKMENLLTPIRQEELTATGAIVDALFQCLDMLQDMVEAHINQEDHGLDVSELVARLEALSQGGAVETVPVAADPPPPAEAAGYPGPISDSISAAISAARNNGKSISHLKIELAAGCELKNVRAFMVLRAVRTLAELLDSVPAESVMVEGEVGTTFDLLLASDEPLAAIEAMALTILEVESARATAYGAEPASATPPAGQSISEVFTFTEYDLTAIRQSVSEGFRLLHAHVQLAEDCALKSARAFMVNKKLEELGDIINIVPDAEDIEFERFDRDLDFLVLTKAEPGAALAALQNVSELDSIEITEDSGVPERPGAPGDAAIAARRPAAAAPAGSQLALPQSNVPEVKRDGAAKVVKQTHTIRVDTERLDMLLNLVGELVIGKTRLQQLASEVQRPELTDTIEQFDQIVFDLQNVVMKTRMMPIETVFNRFPRMIRDLAKQRGKQVELIETGGETELDRTVIEEIGDPLVHLIRNSVDHGIETPAERVAAGKPEKGTLTMAAYHEGSSVFIEIRDDGKGIDPRAIRAKCIEKGLLTAEAAHALTDQEAIEMIFAAGMSTAEAVSDISGRGVGMDVVTSKIKELSGSVKLSSTIGAGTTITIKLPLTLAIVQALLVQIGAETFAIPLAYIEQTLRISPDSVQRVNQQNVYVLRGEVLPLVWMRDLLHSPAENGQADNWFIVVVHSGNQRIGMCVDNPVGQTEIVIKSLGVYLQDTKYIAGGTILGDGTVALILDVARIAE